MRTVNATRSPNAQGRAAFADVPTVPRSPIGPQDVIIDTMLSHIGSAEFAGPVSFGADGRVVSRLAQREYYGCEVIGVVSQVGKEVDRYQPGGIVAIGMLADRWEIDGAVTFGDERGNGVESSPTNSDRNSAPSRPNHWFETYEDVVAASKGFALSIRGGLNAVPAAMPILRAGLTLWLQMLRWQVRSGMIIGVAGCGPVASAAVRIAHAFSAQAIGLAVDAEAVAEMAWLGADHVVVHDDDEAMATYAGKLDLIIDTSDNTDEPVDPGTFLRDDVVRNGNLLREAGIIYMPDIEAGPRRKSTVDPSSAENINSAIVGIQIVSIGDLRMVYDRIERKPTETHFLIDLAGLSDRR